MADPGSPTATAPPTVSASAVASAPPLAESVQPHPTVLPASTPRPVALSPGPADDELVRRENALPGTSAWRLTNYAAAGEIQAYAGAVSVDAGAAIDLYVSTRLPGTSYRIAIFRMGWYGGLGARVMETVDRMVGQAQGYYTVATGLVNCSRCQLDRMTGLVDANWLPSYHLVVPPSWLSGVYLALLTDAAGKQTYVPFVVRQDERNSAILVQASFNTYEAYNAWGGKSLYDYNSTPVRTLNGTQSAVKVSFNRPFDADFGSGQFLRYEYNLVRWLERNGYEVSYTTNSDVAAGSSALLNHRAFISAGHDEYWSATERDRVQAALGEGVNLAFLGGDDVYWQVRYEASEAGVPNRILVCYRGPTDPLATSDPAHETVRWQDSPVSQPENALTGTIYGGQLNPFVQDWVAGDTSTPLFEGTGLTPGSHVVGLVGKEYDHAASNGAAPPNLRILSRSPVHNEPNTGVAFAETTVYSTAAGATVFSAGTITWAWGLDDAAFPLGALHSTPMSPAIQRLTKNLIDGFLHPPEIPAEQAR